MSTTRLVRRVSRATAASTATQASAARTEAEVRRLDEETLDLHLQSIAELNAEIEKRAKIIETRHAQIEEIMKKYGIPAWQHAGLEAVYGPKFSNEKKEIDPRKLYEHKTMKADKHAAFFQCVKVQIGSLGEFLSEGEIKALANITPPQKVGMGMTIKAIKPVVATKPKSKGK